MSILTRWRNRPISPRRARAMYEAQRLRFRIEDLDRENARREQERNHPCPWCAAATPARPAKPTAIHHINGNPYDNRPENLEVVDLATHSRTAKPDTEETPS